jgi:hypothetical protein
MRYAFAQGIVAAFLAGGFTYCVHILFSPSPMVLTLVALATLVGLAYIAKKWN